MFAAPALPDAPTKPDTAPYVPEREEPTPSLPPPRPLRRDDTEEVPVPIMPDCPSALTFAPIWLTSIDEGR